MMPVRNGTKTSAMIHSAFSHPLTESSRNRSRMTKMMTYR